MFWPALEAVSARLRAETNDVPLFILAAFHGTSSGSLPTVSLWSCSSFKRDSTDNSRTVNIDTLAWSALSDA